MADWASWWRKVRVMCDASPEGSIELTIDEIRRGAQSRDNHLQERGWWNAIMDPNNRDYKGVLENGMECDPLPPRGSVERVIFRIRQT